MARSSSRRGTPRLDPQGLVSAADLTNRQDVALIDVGLGGFLVTASSPYLLGETSKFLFESADGQWGTRLEARVIYCQPNPDDPATYLTGFTFIEANTPGVQERVGALIDQVTASVSFDTDDESLPNASRSR